MTTIEIVTNWNKKNQGFLVQQLAFGNGTNDEFIENILMFISDCSTGFQADIAKKTLSSKNQKMRMSEKQAWCIEYELIKIKDKFIVWYNEKYIN